MDILHVVGGDLLAALEDGSQQLRIAGTEDAELGEKDFQKVDVRLSEVVKHRADILHVDMLILRRDEHGGDARFGVDVVLKGRDDDGLGVVVAILIIQPVVLAAIEEDTGHFIPLRDKIVVVRAYLLHRFCRAQHIACLRQTLLKGGSVALLSVVALSELIALLNEHQVADKVACPPFCKKLFDYAAVEVSVVVEDEGGDIVGFLIELIGAQM